MPSLFGNGLWRGGRWRSGLWDDSLWSGNVGAETSPPSGGGPAPTPGASTGWATADLVRKFQRILARGNGGALLENDELWAPDDIDSCLSDAQEEVFGEMIPRVPLAFVGAPVLLTTSDGGITYDFPSYPFGHVEVYAKLANGRELVPTKFNAWGDFLLEGAKIRTPGNRPRQYSGGPYARYCGLPTARISASDEPQLFPAAARELILYRAVILACDVWGATLDKKPFQEKYAESRLRWLTLWKTQSARQSGGGHSIVDGRWWLTLSQYNGMGAA